MIVVYALGGGLGHLTRVRAALFTLGRHEPVTIITSSPFATDRPTSALRCSIIWRRKALFSLPCMLLDPL